MKICLGLLALGLVLLLAGLVWLLGTRSGAEWLLASLDRPGGVRFAAKVKGSVWAGLELSGIRLSWQGGRATIDRLDYSWTPRALLGRRLVCDRLAIGVIRVDWDEAVATSQSPLSPDQLPWPLLPDWLLHSAADIQRLTIAELRINEDEALRLKGLSGSLHFSDGLLRAETLHAQLPCGTLDGDLNLDLAQHQVAADLLWHGKPFFADWDTIHTQVQLDETWSGPLRAETRAGRVERLTVQGNVVLTGRGVTLKSLFAARSRAPDRVTGSVQVDWASDFRLTGELQLAHLNLESEAGWPTDLNGSVLCELTGVGYSGTVDLESLRPALERGRLAAHVVGDWNALQLHDLRGDWLDGEVRGDLQLNWQSGLQLFATLQGTKINPATIVPALPGRLQLELKGGLTVSPTGVMRAEWDATLAPSLLLQQPLSGRVAGRWQDDDLILDTLQLQGDGLQLMGAGRLSRRLDLNFKVVDLSRLVRAGRGEVEGKGWLARTKGAWSGAAGGNLRSLSFKSWQVDGGEFSFNYPGADLDSQLALSLHQLRLPKGSFDAVTVNAQGRVDAHELKVQLRWPKGDLSTQLFGGWQTGEWSGQIAALSGQAEPVGSWQMLAPATLTLSRQHLLLAPLQLLGAEGWQIALAADMRSEPWIGFIRVDGDALPLALVNPWLGGPLLSGQARGALQLDVRSDGALTLAAEVFAAPVLQWDGRELVFAPSHARLHWGEGGLAAAGEVAFARGGQLTLALRSPQPGRMKLPEQGELSAVWQGVDVQQFSLWLPTAVVLHGNWQGQVEGHWQSGIPLLITGKTWIDAGAVEWQEDAGRISVSLRQAELAGHWQDGWLDGELNLALSDQGRVDGHFRLPVGDNDPQAPLRAETRFRIDEFGLLMLMLPGVVNESHGSLTGELRLAGTRSRPQWYGQVALHGAGAEIPALGLKLREVELNATFDDSSMKLQRLHLLSGDGYLQGDGALQLSGWQPQSWSLRLKGEKLQLLHLPEIVLEVTPDVQLSGSAERLIIRGEVLVPTLLVSEVLKAKMVESSGDVVRSDADSQPPARIPVETEVQVRVELGKHVVVKAKGLDAKLEGSVAVATDTHGIFVGSGEIRVVQGHYAAYGIKLPIVRGRASFGSGTLQEPTLDVLAQRTVGAVKAGVQVSGTPSKPVAKLVSDPALPDTEILSYIVLGRPLGTGGGQNDKLLLAANALLSQGESAILREKLQRQIGVDVLEVQSGGGSGVEGSMVAVGKYLTPELYFSFGQSLFSHERAARLRYQLGQRWEVESQVGTVSGADLSYRLEFR